MATATTVDNLSVKWGADFRDLIAAYKEAEKSTAAYRKRIESEMAGAKAAIDRVAAQIKDGLTRLAAGVGLAGLVRMGRDALKTAEDLEQTAKWLGVNVERLQAWEFAARQAGLEQGKLTAGLDKMRGNLADFAADPSSNGAQIFRQLGIALRDGVTGQLRTLDSIIPELASKISTLGTGDKLLVGKTLFGDKNDEVVRFFDSIAGRFREIEDRAKAAGAVFTKEFVEKAAPLHREIELLENKIGKDLKQAVVDFAPAWKLALAAVIEVQEAVDGLLSRVRIGGFRVGKEVSATQRLGELDSDLADARRKLGDRTGQGTPLDRSRRLSPSERQALEQDIRRLEAERAAITDRVDAETAARQRPASYLEQETMLAGITVSPKGPKSDRLRVGGEDEFSKQIRGMQREAKALLDVLDFGPAAASYNRLIAEFSAGNGKIAPSKKQIEDFGEALRLKISREGLVALKDMREEAIASAEAAQLEARGQREAAEAVRIKFELTRRFGPEFAASQEQWIEQLARYKVGMDKIAERTRAAMQELEGLFDGFASNASSEMDAFFNRQKTGWEATRDFAIKALRDIANEIFKLGVINPLKNALFPGSNAPTLFDIGRGAPTIAPTGESAGGIGFLGQIGDWIGNLFKAEGGDVRAGQPYIVGEKRPELFIPDVNGTIVPRVPSGGGVTYIDARGADQVALARLEAIVRAQGSEIRRYQAGEPARVRSHMADVAREGGAVTNLYR